MQGRMAVLGVIGALLVACAGDGAPATPSTPTAPTPPMPTPAPAPTAPTNAVSVMTYNVNFAMAGDRATIRAIREAGADIVFLQETNATWEKHLRRELGGIYEHMHFRHCCRAGGLAVLSKYPFEERAYLDSPIGKFPAWLLEIASPIGALRVLNLHLRPIAFRGGNIVSRYMKTQNSRVTETRAYAKRIADDLPTLVVGDLNEDYGGRSLQLLRRAGFRSALADFDPNRTTWRWETKRGTVRWQLDHILHDTELRTLRADILEGGGSDHLPVVATVALAQ